MKIDGCFSDHSGGIVPTNAYLRPAYKVLQLFHIDYGGQQESHYQEPGPRNKKKKKEERKKIYTTLTIRVKNHGNKEG
jgi:hypothetical protein